MNRFENAGHFIRLALLLAAGLAAFIVFRSVAVPKGFGQYGHFRGPSLEELRAKEVRFAGQDACFVCHDDQHQKVASGFHKTIHCEACHGPQAKHASDVEPKPERPKTPELCVVCHEANTGKPKMLHTVVSKDHSGGEDCKTCHKPHSPREGL